MNIISLHIELWTGSSEQHLVAVYQHRGLQLAAFLFSVSSVIVFDLDSLVAYRRWALPSVNESLNYLALILYIY